MHGTREEFIYLQCDNCGCLQILNYPPNITTYYGEDYYSYSDNLKTSITSRVSHQLKMRRALFEAKKSDFFGRILSFIKPELHLRYTFDIIWPLISNKQKSRLLDVGSGSGRFIEILRALGFENTNGIDPYLKNNTTSGNSLVKNQSLYELNDTYDLIFLNHSLEHMPEQNRIFDKLSQILNKDGLIIVRIPVCDSHAWGIYKEKWVQLDAPRHYYLHTKKSIALLSESAGLKAEFIGCDSYAFQFWGSEQYKKDIPLYSKDSFLHGGSSFTKKDIECFDKQSRELNRIGKGDQAVFAIRHQA